MRLDLPTARSRLSAEVGEPLSRKQAKKVFQVHDYDGDARLNAKEMKANDNDFESLSNVPPSVTPVVLLLVSRVAGGERYPPDSYDAHCGGPWNTYTSPRVPLSLPAPRRHPRGRDLRPRGEPSLSSFSCLSVCPERRLYYFLA